MENEELFEKYKDLTQKKLNEKFVSACENGDLKIVKYLLISPDLKEHANIHLDKGLGLRWACMNGHLEIVQYLLKSPELKYHAKVNENGDNGFISAYYNNSFDVIKYLIFDFKIEKSPNIKNALNNNPKEEVIRMFKIRELNKHLEKELNSDKVKNRKLKV